MPKHALALLLPLLLPWAALAEGMRIEPGKWEFESTSRTPMAPAPRVEKHTECLTLSEMTPDRFLKDMDGCSVSGAKSDAGSMQWEMSCPNPMGEMKGGGRFTSSGDALSGSTDMSMTVNGRPMEMRIDWKGRRLGPC